MTRKSSTPDRSRPLAKVSKPKQKAAARHPAAVPKISKRRQPPSSERPMELTLQEMADRGDKDAIKAICGSFLLSTENDRLAPVPIRQHITQWFRRILAGESPNQATRWVHKRGQGVAQRLTDRERFTLQLALSAMKRHRLFKQSASAAAEHTAKAFQLTPASLLKHYYDYKRNVEKNRKRKS